MSLKYKFLFTLFAIGLIPFLFIGLLSYSNTRQLITEETLAKLNTIKNLKVTQIEQTLHADKEKLALVLSGSQIPQLVADYNKKSNPEDLRKLKAILTDIKSLNHEFSEVTIVNTNGKIIVSTNTALINVDKSLEQFFINGKEKDSAGYFFRNQDNTLSLYISGPLRLKNELLGVLVINAHADHYLSIFADYAELGETGETYFVLRDGNYALAIHPLRFDKNAAFNRKSNLEDQSKPVSRALSGNTGVFLDTVDYRGKPVLSATHYFEDLDAGLAVKIDKSEAFAAIGTFQVSFLIISFSVLIFILLIVISLTTAFTKPIAGLSTAAKKLSQGNFTSTVYSNSHDEIGQLAQSFNTMSKELQSLYQDLESKVKEKTIALNNKLEETEKLNQVMLGREAKIIELKTKIRELEEKIKTNSNNTKSEERKDPYGRA